MISFVEYKDCAFKVEHSVQQKSEGDSITKDWEVDEIETITYLGEDGEILMPKHLCEAFKLFELLTEKIKVG